MAGEPAPAPPTLERAILDAASALAAAGVDSPRLSAELLAGHALGCDRLGLVMRAKDRQDLAFLERYRQLVARRAGGEPAAYILGEREFYGLTFRVSPAVLIPRPETERMVELALGFFAPHQPLRFADFGTGSGALAVTLAHEFPKAAGLAVDLSDQALLVARSNAELNAVAHRLCLLRADFTRLSLLPGCLDLVVANPPYVTEDEYVSLSPEVRGFEPRQSLVSPQDGLWHLSGLLPVAARALRPGGRLLCEIGSGQGGVALDLLRRSQCGLGQAEILPDHAGIDRVLSAVRQPQV